MPEGAGNLARLTTPDWLQALTESSSVAIAVLRDRHLFVNPGYQRLTGYSADELARMAVWETVRTDYLDGARRTLRALLAGDEASDSAELPVVRKDGAVRWINFSWKLIEHEGERAILAVGIDVTAGRRAKDKLGQSEERLRLAQHAGRSVIWDWDLETDELTSSSMANEIAGFAFDQAVRTGREFRQLIHPEDRENFDSALRAAFRTTGQLAAEIRIVPPGGGLRWVAERGECIRNAEGQVTRVIGVAQDITERKLAEEALFRETERAQVTLASIGDGVIRTDARGAVDYLNPVAEQLTGWPLSDAYGRPVGDVFRVADAQTRTRLLDPVTLCLRERRQVLFPGNRILHHRDGSESVIQDSAAPIRDRAGEIIGAVVVFKDLSQLQQMREQMSHLANHDALTGLLNRRAFEAALEEALASARREDRQHALCYLDLDQFKLVNDTCGHDAGDELIKQLGGVISSRLGRDDVLARMGGDEFGVLLRDSTAGEARETAERISDAVRRLRFSWEDRVFAMGISTGLVPITGAEQDLTSLLSAADAACYVAKEAGRNRIHEYQPGDTAVAEHYGQMQWISRIHKALAEERLCLYRQEIRPLSNKARLSPLYEILVRMLDRQGRVVEPDLFIPAAERYHLVSAIDRWVVRQALTTLAKLEDDVHFVINVSGQSLSEEAFLVFVAEQFRKSGAQPDRILFEITETAAIADPQSAMRFMWVCKGLGCQFVLDDFGMGLSSYSYLKDLPVDALKIAGEFVSRMAEDPIEAAIVRSINEVGQVMGLQTIAEAVETDDALEAVRALGVDYAQGFSLAHPEPLLAPANA